MGGAVNNHEFTEVFVESDLNRLLRKRSGKNHFVTRIAIPFARPNSIVSPLLQLVPGRSPDAGVEKESY